jgi:hypothetical protein
MQYGTFRAYNKSIINISEPNCTEIIRCPTFLSTPSWFLAALAQAYQYYGERECEISNYAFHKTLIFNIINKVIKIILIEEVTCKLKRAILVM